MARLSMGYVGCGFMAQKVHIPNILALDECELAAVAEVRGELGARVQKRHGIPKLYADHRELAEDSDIAAVAVSGHFSSQGEIAIDLLDAGKDVFMEKPMAVSITQAERILEAEERSGRRLMIGYMKRYDAGNILVKDLLERLAESGEMGSVQFVRNHGFCGDWLGGLDTPMEKSDEPMPEPPPTTWPEWLPEARINQYVGYLQQYTHNVNLVRWFLDAKNDMSVVAADLDTGNGISGVALLDVEGVRAVIESGHLPYHGWEEHTQIYFERGWVKTCAPPLLLRNVAATVEVYRAEDQSHSEFFPPEGYTWSYKEEMRHFADCVLNDKPFRSPASDAMEDVRTLENIYRDFIERL